MSILSLEIDLLYVCMDANAVLSPRPTQILSPALDYRFFVHVLLIAFEIRIALGAFIEISDQLAG